MNEIIRPPVGSISVGSDAGKLTGLLRAHDPLAKFMLQLRESRLLVKDWVANPLARRIPETDDDAGWPPLLAEAHKREDVINRIERHRYDMQGALLDAARGETDMPFARALVALICATMPCGNRDVAAVASIVMDVIEYHENSRVDLSDGLRGFSAPVLALAVRRLMRNRFAPEACEWINALIALRRDLLNARYRLGDDFDAAIDDCDKVIQTGINRGIPNPRYDDDDSWD